MKFFSFGIPKKASRRVTFSWRPFVVFGVILAIALGMRVYQWVRGPVVPTAEVAAVEWDDIAHDDVGVVVDVASGDTESRVFDTPDSGSELGIVDSVKDVSLVAALPDAMNLAVPFTSQAPLGIWDAFTEETCEEASLLMVQAYYKNIPEGTLDTASADADFRAMAAVEERLGFGVSISTAQFTTFADAYDGTVVRTIEHPSVDDLRALLAAGHPVIIPAFGRRLGNPFFTGEGPLYHMLVLRGYTPTTFITNDPGTRHGENYQYPREVVMSALGDWDGDSPDGGSRVMVLEP